ncbi:uncharacterized protein FYW47_005295 [Aplochiton taeniatus]
MEPEEPLYDFPEPQLPSERRWAQHQRGRSSLKSISILDRLMLTLPVWLQLSINSATSLHILQREPPGAFLVRQSRTSQRKVLCVRLTDNSVPSFVRQFQIREEPSTLSLDTSAIIFPDLSRLIAYYCVSRDVLPFPLELPEAIAKATSHKQLESISHMGVEFWSSQLNFRGPRDDPSARATEEKKSDSAPTGSPAATVQPGSTSHPIPASFQGPPLQSAGDAQPSHGLFKEFCPIETRSPGELNCGPGQGALCFINPLFPPGQTTLQRRRLFMRSLKVRVSTETSGPLSPPLAPPPPPPLLPKLRGKGKARPKPDPQAQLQAEQPPSAQPTPQLVPPSQRLPQLPPKSKPRLRADAQEGPCQGNTGEVHGSPPTQPPHTLTTLQEDSEFKQPILSPFSCALSAKDSPSSSPYHSPKVSPGVSPLAPHASSLLSPMVTFSLLPRAPDVPEEDYHTPSPLIKQGKWTEVAGRSEGDGRQEEASEADGVDSRGPV